MNDQLLTHNLNRKVLDYLIIALRSLYSKTPSNSTEAALPLKVLQNFYMEHDHLVEATLKEVAIPLLTYIQKNSLGEEQFREDVLKFGIRFMENITSYFATILNSLSISLDSYISTKNNEKSLEVINLIEFTFRLETMMKNKEENFNYGEQRDYLKSIISGILRSVSSIQSKQILSSPFVYTALSLTLRLTENLDEILENLQKESTSDQNFVGLTSPLMDKKLDDSMSAFIEFYKLVVDRVLDSDDEDLSTRSINLVSLSSQISTRMPKYETQRDPKKMPEWVNPLVKCIKANNSTLAIVGIENLLRIIIVEANKLPIYEEIKQLLKTEAENTEAEDLIHLAMEKLWNLLDHHYDQNKICELLILFQAHYSDVFRKIVSKSFKVTSITEKENAIRRFASFWKVAGEFYRNSPFLTSGIGLFIMMDFLDNDNPLLRHTSKSWLIDSIPHLYRIIDPIFEVLLTANVSWYVTDTKQYFYTNVYNTSSANEAFRKFKSILITTNELFIKYISTIRVSEKLKSFREKIHDEEFEKLESFSYLDLLVILCLRYIQGQAIESLSLQFQLENSSVNASACEFLELLITHLENKENSARITHHIMEPLLLVLYHSIQNRDYVMQVQLINLMKVILFQSSYTQYEESKYRCVALLSSRYFVPNLLRGLEIPMQYVRVQYINFISLCMSILTDHLKHPTLTSLIHSVLKTYFDIILSKNLDEKDENGEDYEAFESEYISLEGQEDISVAEKRIKMEGDRPETQKALQLAISQTNSASTLPSRFDKKKFIQPEKIKEEADREKKKNMFSVRHQNQNEIYMLLEGVKKILQYFLNLRMQVRLVIQPNAH